MGNSGLKQHYETAKKTGVLKISQEKLTEFPSNLKQLESVLRTLDLSDNKLSTLPSDIGSFKLLKHLNINKNRLESLPVEIGNLTKLESLSVCSNKLTTLPSEISKLLNLKQVYLSDNALSEFPLVFCKIRHLDVLDVSKNKIASIPDGVEDLYVTELNANQNQLTKISKNIAQCPRLKTLRIEENCLNLSAIHQEILTDSNISVLAVEGNLFDSKSFAELEGFDGYMKRYTAMKKKMF
ncbi:hypothetical protein R5R35_007623 [Gryllus longicercus]|uniref:Leucine-rich repeat-containing protein 57 n=1 Tax=Gryllus longicercus TaxID=2509291 RepID=A0AAN9Z243_9ORTH